MCCVLHINIYSIKPATSFLHFVHTASPQTLRWERREVVHGWQQWKELSGLQRKTLRRKAAEGKRSIEINRNKKKKRWCAILQIPFFLLTFGVVIWECKLFYRIIFHLDSWVLCRRQRRGDGCSRSNLVM